MHSLEIRYTPHLELRMKMREIPFEVPRKIFEDAEEHYYDNLTKHFVAIHQIKFHGKMREMALTYDRKKEVVELITRHPIQPYQKHGRIRLGRWEKA